MSDNAICSNCETLITGKYCSNCGQKAYVARLTLHELLHEVWHALTHTDKGILKLIKDLALHPAQVYNGYFKGQRKKYFSPVLFFLVTAGLAAFLYPYIFDYQDKLYNTNDEFARTVYHIVKFRALLLLPLEVMLIWLFFHRRFNFAEVTVFWLFCLGFTFVVRICSMPFYFPFIHHKLLIDNIVTLLAYAVIFWHSVAVFARRKFGNMLMLLVLTNVILIADGLLQGYLLFGYSLTPKGDFDFFNYLKMIYGFK